ncbi:MAG: type II toxin-antitoxin system VapC family toxin [Gammaproteobacteria bacterium]|nr:type II toxin-antitoxin system VapC family toxin [Gammaproteobacteria bacterium]
MIFVDTNVFMYAVGREHPLKPLAREFFLAANRDREQLATSAEVLQELTYCYLSVNRRETLDAALLLITKAQIQVWNLEGADVYLACQLHDQFPALSARDLCHLASCQRRNVSRIKTFDRRLAAVVQSKV